MDEQSRPPMSLKCFQFRVQGLSIGFRVLLARFSSRMVPYMC